MRYLMVLLCLSVLISCVQANKNELAPAHISELSSESLKELHEVIANALDQDSVVIAKTIFSESSFASFSFPDLTGRVLSKPRVFRLMRSENACFLVDQNASKEMRLKYVKCVLSEAEQ